MAWTIPFEVVRQVRVMNCVGVDGVKPDYSTVGLCENMNPKITGANEFVGRTFEEIIDLIDAR